MVLLYPTATGIFRPQEHQHGSFKLRHFVFRQALARQTACQDAVQLAFTGFREQHYVQRVVRHFTAVGGEVVQTFRQRGLQIGKAADIGIRHFSQFGHVVVKGRLFDVEGFIRTPARQHFHAEGAVFCDGSVMFQ